MMLAAPPPPVPMRGRRSQKLTQAASRKLQSSKRKHHKATRSRYQRLLNRRKRTRNKVIVLLGGKDRHKQRLTVWMKIARQVLKEAALPLFFAALWVAYKYPEARGIGDMFAHAAAATAGVLIIQGNVLRIAKNIRDGEHIKRTASSFRQMQGRIATIETLGWSTFRAVERLSLSHTNEASRASASQGKVLQSAS